MSWLVVLSCDEIVRTVDPLVCRAVTSPVVLDLPAGIFSPPSLPLQEMSASDNPSVHVFDMLPHYTGHIDFRELET
ncbi:unnamed protein product, partial [Symbiodinium sp. CCMP2456]